MSCHCSAISLALQERAASIATARKLWRSDSSNLMNYRLLFLLCLLVLLPVAFAADQNAVKIPNVTVTVSDFTLDYSPISKEVALLPAAGGTIRTGVSDAD